MYDPQRTVLPTWAKVLIGLVAAFAVLAVVAVAIGALFLTRVVRVVQSESSGEGDTTFSSTLRWQKGVLFAGVAVDPTHKESARIVKVTSVTLNGVVADHYVSNLQKPGILSFPLERYRGVGGDREQIRINYETPNTGESGYESTTADVPARPTDRAKK